MVGSLRVACKSREDNAVAVLAELLTRANLMSQSHIAPLFIFCLVLNDYHNALSVFGLIICYCFMLRFYCVVFYAFVVFLSI
ncbi:hypothetical protein [Escherichia coli]|uniref:hypothetical protein n=1 Tax=Escherichia coli TaxID=562 RepID=UPI0033978386